MTALLEQLIQASGQPTAADQTLPDVIRAGEVYPARPWPRHAVTSQGWRDLVRVLAEDQRPRFEALWADPAHVYVLLTRPEPLLISAPVEAGVYAALSPARREAAWFERAIGDLWGHLAAHALDTRPLLDHGYWPALRPMSPRPVPNAGAPAAPELRPTPEGALALQFGPIAPGEPVLTVLAARGETLVQAEWRTGFAHRGVLALMQGRTAAECAPLVARLSAESTVAHSLAFAEAAEAAAATEPPPRARGLRGVAFAVEQVAIALYDVALMLEAAGHDPASAMKQRESLMRASLLAFGHRMLMDFVVPGGIAADVTQEGVGHLMEALAQIRPPSDRLLSGRAVSAVFDARIALLSGAAEWIRKQFGALPNGPFRAAVAPTDGEGLGRAQGPRGTHWHWVLFRAGRVAETFACDPGWRLWQGLERALVGRPIADLPLVQAALGAPVAGVDL